MNRCAIYLVTLILAFTTIAVRAQTGGLITQCSNPGVVALTFDDGPSENTDKLLNELKAAGVPATFFLLGVQIDNVDNSTGLIQRMLDEGHQLGLHTYSHPDMDTLSTSERQQEMDQVLTLVQNAVDLRPNYMRPPFGSCDDGCVKDMNDLDYQVIIWNVDSNDWRFRDNGTTRANAIAGTKQNIQSVIKTSDSETDNFIILQHDTIDYSVALVPQVVKSIRKKGFTFSTVADCLDNGIPAYADDESTEDDTDNTDDDGTDNADDNSAEGQSNVDRVSKTNGNQTDGTVNAASVSNNTESTYISDSNNGGGESGAAWIAPRAIITILGTMLVTMLAL